MKRVALITIVVAAILWIAYAGYELFFKDANKIAPKHLFCEADGGVLLINRIHEVKRADYLKVIESNDLSASLHAIDSLYISYPKLRIYASVNRDILVLDNEDFWKRKDEKTIKAFFPQEGVQLKREGRYVRIATDFKSCTNNEALDIFIEADKKASANYWQFTDNRWKRTDVYNLDKGFFEYRSSDPGATYGKAVNEVDRFSPVLPSSLSNYTFYERFYAAAQDSIFREGPMGSWVDLGYVTFNYRDQKILCSDYRSKQQPGLILIERTEQDDSVNVDDEIMSFQGFKLTNEFPESSADRIFVMEIEDKVFFSSNKKVLQQLKIDYQLGKTLALQPKLKKELFGGLPTLANYRFVNPDRKMSLTWKQDLLFEVNTQPPHAQLTEEERTSWSYSPEFKIFKIVPIPDHLRKGTSALVIGEKGNYELIGPFGNQIWKGSVSGKIVGDVKVVDVFDNDKHQFLLRTERKVHLIDLNGNEVGGFPYRSDHKLTSGISAFVWNGTKRFLVGNEKGEVIMLNSSGRELTIIQLSSNPIINKPYALNVKGNLRSWAIDKEGSQFLGYLETPAKAEKLGKTTARHFAKYDGTVVGYFEKEGEIYSQQIENQESQLVEKGSIAHLNENVMVVNKESTLLFIGHNGQTSTMIDPPFNEINSIHLIEKEDNQFVLVMDYLKNKIYLYNSLGEVVEEFPKEGRKNTYCHPNEMSERLSIYTTIENSIVCYKVKL